MQLDTVKLRANDLAIVDGIFASFKSHYSRAVTINFTDGKINDLRWGREPEQTVGLTNPSNVQVDEGRQSCTASVLIDIWALVGNSVTPESKVGRQTIPRALSPKAFRYNAIIAVVHELAHVLQGWQLGRNFAKDLFDEKISAAARAEDYSAINPDMPNSPYLQNQFESGARDFVSRWSSNNRDKVHTGRFDFMLPMTTVRGIFWDSPGIFGR